MTPLPRSLWMVLVASVALSLLLFAACGDEEEQQEPECELTFDDGQAFDTLSEYCFFQGALADHEPTDGVVPYDVTSELYSDHSWKRRFIALPEGEQIGFHPTDIWDWPDGAVLIKTFYYPHDVRSPEAGEQILETRLLVKRDGDWEPEVYVWDDDQQEAHRFNIGDRVAVSFIDDQGDEVDIDYRIPERAMCADCHVQDGDTVPLGPRTRQLLTPYQRDESLPPQVEFLADQGMFDASIPDISELEGMPDPHDEDEPLEDRARSYLDANCAHCHSPGGRASTSNLHLEYTETNERRLGLCKTPVAAGPAAGGRNYDIVPGEPDESIMVYRMESTDPEIKMPELPITTVDEFGVDLVRQWITAMEPADCN